MRTIHSQPITHETEVNLARRSIRLYAGNLGFAETDLEAISIAVQEIGTNAVRYATDGIVHWSPIYNFVSPCSPARAPQSGAPPFHGTSNPFDGIQGKECGLEIFYADKGPGIYDLARSMRDGVSFGGGLGGGFGAIKRMMDEVDVYSTVQTSGRLSSTGARRTTHGTAILCRKWLPGARPTQSTNETLNSSSRRSIGTWSRPFVGETLNGDAYFVREDAPEDGGRTFVGVIDGLGHGSGAHEAAQVALEVLNEWQGEPLDELIAATHAALRATRGAVMSVVLVEPTKNSFQFAGVGNIQTRIFNAPEPVHPISTNGTLGARLTKAPIWTHPWAEGTTIIIASDGISTMWDINSYPGLLNRSPQLIAGILARDFGRDSDDATVVVIR